MEIGQKKLPSSAPQPRGKFPRNARIRYGCIGTLAAYAVGLVLMINFGIGPFEPDQGIGAALSVFYGLALIYIVSGIGWYLARRKRDKR